MSTTEWSFNAEKSRTLFERACKVIPQGCLSDPQGPAIYQPHPIFIQRGKGSKIYDVDGNEFLDFFIGAGPLILGHANPEINKAVREQLENGTAPWAGTELAVEVAERVVNLVPSAEMVRFSSSGTEAVMHALRLARGYTGKDKILKFEGQFHGDSDYVLFSIHPPQNALGMTINPHKVPASAGIPESIADTLLVASWNDPSSIEKIITRHRNELAAVLTAPVPCSMGVVPPEDGFLQTLRQLTAENDLLLILDEVITGFRVALGGAQQLFDVKPDLSIFAKALGGGVPISALTGRREIMECIGFGRVAHMGTMNGNPLVLAAANAT